MFALTEKSIALNDFVIIKVLPNETLKIGNIFLNGRILENSENMKLIKGTVVSCGKLAETEFGIKKNDVILFDKHSIFGDSFLVKGTELVNSIVVTKAENVILNIKD